MNSRITRLAVATAIVVAMLLGLHYLGGPPMGATIAWADVLKNIDVNVGDVTLQNLDFVIMEADQLPDRDGMLGGDFFQKYQVFIDNENNTLYVRPAAGG